MSDEPRPGELRRISDAKVEEVIARTLESTPAKATHWSTRDVAQVTGVSRATVHRIWQAFGPQPRRTESSKLSADPFFIEKVRDITGLYLNPPDRALVLCQEVVQVLDVIESRDPPDLDVHVVLDNYGARKAPKIKQRFPRHPRYHLHFTPASASWLNQVERFFAEITRRRIRRGTFESVRSLEQAIREYLQEHNRDPKPFVWATTADEILANVKRSCERTSETGH